MAEIKQKITLKGLNGRVTTLEQDVTGLKSRVEDISYVEIDNGIKKKIQINEAVKMILDDIEILRDANKLHRIFKRYKLYKRIPITIGILTTIILWLFGWNGWSFFLKLIK